VRVAEHLEKELLRHVLGDMAIAKHAVGKAVRRPLEFLQELVEGRRLTGRHP